MILDGRLHPGQVTSVQELIALLHLGRSPIRDVVLKLNDENMVAVKVI